MSGRGRGRGQQPIPVEPVPAPTSPDDVVEAVAELGISDNAQVQHESVLEASVAPRSVSRGRGMRGAPMAGSSGDSTLPISGSRARGRGGVPKVNEDVLGTSSSLSEPRSSSVSPSQLADQVMSEPIVETPVVVAAPEERARSTAGASTHGSQAAGSDGFTEVHMKPREPARQPVDKRGVNGTPVKNAANLIRVRIADNKGYYEYRVDYTPHIECSRTRKMILKQCEGLIGKTKSYDGRNLLYLPTSLPTHITEVAAHLPNDPNERVVVNFQYVRKLELVDSVQFYNILLNSIQRILGLVEMGRNFYDWRATHQIPQHKLEVWPGYVTRIDEVADGLMLCLDASHRVLRKTTVLEMLESFRTKDPNNYRDKFKDFIIGKLVVTKYKYDCYKVDDVAWNTDPTATFLRKNTEVRFMDYYKQQYDLTVTDLTQPLLVSKPKQRRQEKPGEVRLISLIPEFCVMSGLSDEMKANFTLMKDLAVFTRITPQKRVACLEAYIKNVNTNPEVKELLDSWGIIFEEALIHLEGRIIAGPDIEINSRMVLKAAKADFSRECTTNHCYQPIELRNFVVICTKQDKPIAETMLKTYSQVCGPLGIKMGPPARVMTVDRITPNDYRKVLKEVADPKTIQLAIVMLPSARDDLYGAVKQHCIVDCPIPSQVLLTKTVKSDKKLRAVMQKVALQINCKLGGAIWSLGIPLKTKIMFVGVDVYHDPKRKNPSVTALVSTLDTKCTSYFSRVIYQKPHQENADSIKTVFCLALEEFCKVNGGPPDRIVVFRDGVSDGQWELVKETEVKQLTSAIEHMCADKMPQFTFVVVQKRISERFFAMTGTSSYDNPPPGSILDHTINRKYHFDFFVVSQLVRQGTVSPTHYVVLEDTSNIKPDLMQKFAFATTYMYFNWPGTIRVPAMCQYAHKLAYLAGQHLKHEPSMVMERLLYYL